MYSCSYVTHKRKRGLGRYRNRKKMRKEEERKV